MRSMRGYRKMIVFGLACIFLLIGLVLALVFPSAGAGIYGAYATGVTGTAGLFVYGNTKEHTQPAGPTEHGAEEA